MSTSDYARILAFYNGEKTESGLTFEDIIGFNSSEFETCYNFVQWLFPLPTKSNYSVSAPVLTKEESKKMSMGPGVKDKITEAFFFMCKRYSLSVSSVGGNIVVRKEKKFNKYWFSSRNHNTLRITRMLTCLMNFGLEEYAYAFYGCLLSLSLQYPGRIKKTTWDYWEEAVFPEKYVDRKV